MTTIWKESWCGLPFPSPRDLSNPGIKPRSPALQAILYQLMPGNNLRVDTNDTTLMAESEEELKSLLMKVKGKSEKAGLKFNIQKTKIMASGPITSWQIDGETVANFIFLGSKMTVDSDCNHKIKRLFLLGRKAMTNLDSILKSTDITLLTKVHVIKAMVFSIVMYIGYS